MGVVMAMHPTPILPLQTYPHVLCRAVTCPSPTAMAGHVTFATGCGALQHAQPTIVVKQEQAQLG